MLRILGSSPPRHKVAIITRTCERPVLLQRALESVSAQSFRNFVWVIVNDGGMRDPVDRVASQARAASCDVVVVHLQESAGMENASNLGIKACRSTYIAIHDDDDAWHPDFLKIMTVELDSHEEWSGAACRVVTVDERIEGDGRVVEISRSQYKSWMRAVYLIDMMQENLFPPIAFLFRRSVYDALGGFNVDLPVLGDWDFHLRILQRGDIGLVDHSLAHYHLRHEAGAYANTLTSNMALHALVDAKIRNAWLRRDLDAGRFGIGTLMGLGRQHYAMWKLLFKAISDQ